LKWIRRFYPITGFADLITATKSYRLTTGRLARPHPKRKKRKNIYK